jgi:hypothetical protein
MNIARQLPRLGSLICMMVLVGSILSAMGSEAATYDVATGGLDRLTIENPSTRLAALASSHSDIAPEQIRHPLPGPVLPPTPEVLGDNLPWRKVVGQQAPRTATTEDIKDRLQDLTLWDISRAAHRAWPLGREVESRPTLGH